MTEASEKESQLIGEAVWLEAAEIFSHCGRPDDFCVQVAESLIFGGWNRIRLTKHGWVAFADSCSPEFLEKFAEWRKL